MSEAYRTALQSLAAIRMRLTDLSLSARDREAALAEFDVLLDTLSRANHRADKIAMARRVQRLDEQLKDRSPRERNAIVMERLGISSKSWLWELRQVRLTPNGSTV